jgi:hypothetical protein
MIAGILPYSLCMNGVKGYNAAIVYLHGVIHQRVRYNRAGQLLTIVLNTV